ncbi:anti-silence-domain-containing protein [Wallemia mellicola]|nr:anti-silence-domain-containing protein [Wallemia mellicola]
MSIISISRLLHTLRDVQVGNPIARWSDPFKFTVTFECISHLPEDLEWKLIYVGSSSSVNFDQELDSCLVGPVPVGVNSFTFEADPPSVDKIPKEEILGVTVLLLTASYRDQEFVRVGYYVHNEYDSDELRENPPENIAFDKLNRSILVEKPRVTRVAIDWYAAMKLGTETKKAVANGSQLPPVPAPATFEELNDVALQEKEEKKTEEKTSPKKEVNDGKENKSAEIQA